MHYYPHNIGDFRKDTPHLSPSQKGIYRDLLDYAYTIEKPLPHDVEMLCRVCGAVKPAERVMVGELLKEFFVDTEDGWEHKRVIHEIRKFYAKQKAGASGADAKHYGKQSGKTSGKQSGSEDGRESGERGSNHNARTNQEPITNNQQPSKPAATGVSDDDLDPGSVPTGSEVPEKKERGGGAELWVGSDSAEARAAINRAVGRDEKRGFSPEEAHYLGEFAAATDWKVCPAHFDEVLKPFLMAEPRFDKPALAGWGELPKESLLLKRRRSASKVFEDLANQFDFARAWLESQQKKERGRTVVAPPPTAAWVAWANEKLGWSVPADAVWEQTAASARREFMAAWESEQNSKSES